MVGDSRYLVLITDRRYEGPGFNSPAFFVTFGIAMNIVRINKNKNEVRRRYTPAPVGE